MSKTEFLQHVRAFGLELAAYAARLHGVTRAQVELWALGV